VCKYLHAVNLSLVHVADSYPVFNPHFSPGSREQAQDSYSKAPLWSEKRSNSYGLSEEQAYGYEDQPEP